MELELVRTYFTEGTNGKIFLRRPGTAAGEVEDRLMMYSIELPWKDNRAGFPAYPKEDMNWQKDGA